MKDMLNQVVSGGTLSEEEAFQTMNMIMKGEATQGQLMSLLSVLRHRGETVEEITGFVKAMRSHMKTVNTEFHNLVDTCGTGGDGASTFNVSTAVSVVLASLGVKIAKHGNRKVSSSSGSADVLEELGIPIDPTPEDGAQALRDKGMTFLFAPLYHEAMKHAAPARQELGFRTVFNLLGPMSNPAGAKRQLIGIYDTTFAEKMAKALRDLGSEHVLLVTGRDGLDEITVTDQTDVVELKSGNISRYTITPEDFGLTRGQIQDLQISHSRESAALIRDVLKGHSENKSAEAMITLNAGAGLYVAGVTESIQAGVIQAQEALRDGTVHRYFESIVTKKENQLYA